MRTKLTTSLAASTLAFFATTASADQAVTTFFLLPTFGDGLTQIFQFDDLFGKAGTSFLDIFLFDSPPATANVAFSALSGFDLNTGQQEVSFSSFSLTPYQPGEGVTPIALNSTVTSFFGSGQTLAPVDVGLYELQISGLTRTDGAAFSGVLEATVPAAVPEPATWLLLLIGMGVFGVSKRKREWQVEGTSPTTI